MATAINEKIDSIYKDLLLINEEEDMLFLYSKSDNRIYFSNACVKQFSIPPCIEDPVLEYLLECLMVKDVNRLREMVIQHLINKHTNFFVDMVAYNQLGEERKLYLKIVVAYDKEGNIAVAKGLAIDLNLTGFLSHYAEEQSYIDQLTKLPNRKAFHRDWEVNLKKPNSNGYIILIDIDNMQLINATFGFVSGEKVLWHIANKLPKAVKKAGICVYQIVAGEYAIMLPDYSAKDAEKAMQSIRAYFKREAIGVNGKKIHVTVSCGAVAYYGGLDYAPDRLLLNAELAVQKVKQGGKDGYSFYNRGDGILHKHQFEIISDLERAVKNNCCGFELYYQPIISTKTLQCMGAEALLRWNSPKSKMIMPNVFIPLLEKTDLIAEVEKWIFNQACTQCATWVNKWGLSDFKMHINLSSKQLLRDSLYSEIMGAVNGSGISTSNLILETTESSLILELDKGIDLFHKLRKEGISIAVDDFGTGYSSLSYLKDLPVDEIKVDKSFVTDIEHSVSCKNFLTGIVSIIQNLQYYVCVEGVETQKQKEFLTSLEVDTLQGFFFSRPVTTLEFERHIHMKRG